MTDNLRKMDNIEVDREDSNLSRAYWVAWSKIDGVGATLLYRIQQHFGSVVRAWHAPIEELQAIDGFGAVLLSKIAQNKPKIDPENLLIEYSQKNPLFWIPDDREYPRLLLEIPSVPSLLHYNGSVEMAENNGDRTLIGIVGTREPTHYGKKWTQRLSKALAQHGITVVSGMAAGIDTVAHYGCLEAGGRTIAVLGTGVDRIYPPENKTLYQEIGQKGLILSEYSAGTPPDRRTFPSRNRIIAGLCRAVIVMEAPKQSGALITARYANEFGRDVYILPASLDQPQSFGCLELIDKGAQVILGEEHLLEMLGTIPQLAPSPELEANKQPSNVRPSTKRQQQTKLPTTQPPVDLEPMLASIWQLFDSIEEESISFDVLAKRTDLAANELSSGLLQLELMGSIVQLPGMRYQKA
jgi:DNA processing protein